MVVPSPSCPFALLPQQRAVPSLGRAHEDTPRIEICVTFVSVPLPAGFLTITGRARLVAEPSPSCPLALLPQQRTVPSLNTARMRAARLDLRHRRERACAGRVLDDDGQQTVGGGAVAEHPGGVGAPAAGGAVPIAHVCKPRADIWVTFVKRRWPSS